MRVTVVHNALPDVLLTPFSMRHPRASKGLSVPDHVHNEGMLVLVHEGLVLVQSGAEVWTVLPGSLGWIPPGVDVYKRQGPDRAGGRPHAHAHCRGAGAAGGHRGGRHRDGGDDPAVSYTPLDVYKRQRMCWAWPR